MFKLLTENWTLKLISLVFALLLWMFIMGERRLEVGYLVPLELQNIPQGLMVANEVPSLVDVRVSGPRTLLMKISPNDISIIVDLIDLKPGLTTFKRLEERLNLPSGLRVTRLSPSFIDLKLERIKSKKVPIKIALTGEPLPGFQIGRIMALPDNVLVEGAETELKSVTEVTTEEVDLGGVNEGFSVIVPLVHRGTYTYLKDDKTTEVQVEIQAVEALPALEDEKFDQQKTK
ncbi:MAG: CdaR family protein [Deltaproteobacteria bacterium]|jgi:YbbR domain-containing protein|nr:CdaR family protein [Deltaproteobacteria bacterium]MCW8893286.1 CdaR family protein [Deltaproteobacteria bacterium]MCW9049944.1 CdaR family protein [Deltaproteobacteria bacterium]